MPLTTAQVPELLAPAGSFDMLVAAIAAGADAVYLGGRRFGARQFSENFDDEALAGAVDYAHARGVKVYVTVNTLIFPEEMEEAVLYLVFLYETGVDAVLVQDLGLLSLAREIVPGLALHASTQMTIHNTEGVFWAASLGITRVVAARELSLPVVSKLVEAGNQCGVGMEVFAHGALCYAYSGQCLFSALAGGRSGNRGMCAQPCRKKYDLVSADSDPYGRPLHQRPFTCRDPYLLSTRDLCTYPALKELVSSGISALKIEGRMRSPAYAATVTSVYRKALDAVAAGSFVPSRDELDNLALAFSRGFTRGYLFGERGQALMGRDLPDDRGILVGTVEPGPVFPGTVRVHVSRAVMIERGDGLVIRDYDGAEEGLVCHDPPRYDHETLWLPSRRPHRAGARVWLTSRKARNLWYASLMRNPDERFRGSIRVDLSVTITPDGAPFVDATAQGPGGRDVHISYESPFGFEKALTQPLSEGQIREQFMKSSHPLISIGSLSLEYPGGLFAPPSVVNSIRRDVFVRIEASVVQGLRPDRDRSDESRMKCTSFFSRDARTAQPASGALHVDLVVMVDSPESVSAALSGGCHEVQYECRLVDGDGRVQGVTVKNPRDPSAVLEELGEVAQQCIPEGKIPSWKLPRIIDSATMTQVRAVISSLGGTGITRVVTDSPWMPHAFPGLTGVEWTAGSGCNIVNGYAASALGQGFNALVTSPEASLSDITHIVQHTGKKVMTLVQGQNEVMITEDPLFELFKKAVPGDGGDRLHGIRDSRGKLFTLWNDPAGRVVIRNAVETCLVDYLPNLIGAGVSGLLIDARGRTSRYTQAATELYRDALRCTAFGPPLSSRALQGFRRRARAISAGGMTIGHLFMRTADDGGTPE
jgi:putative protease